MKPIKLYTSSNCPDCELVWTGADCRIAIEDNEWKD